MSISPPHSIVMIFKRLITPFVLGGRWEISPVLSYFLSPGLCSTWRPRILPVEQWMAGKCSSQVLSVKEEKIVIRVRHGVLRLTQAKMQSEQWFQILSRSLTQGWKWPLPKKMKFFWNRVQCKVFICCLTGHWCIFSTVCMAVLPGTFLTWLISTASKTSPVSRHALPRCPKGN
jgi:hypothetical protein